VRYSDTCIECRAATFTAADEAREVARRQRQQKYRQKYGQTYRQTIRTKVLDHYGWACVCCGTTENPSIDHINGGGTAHRREPGILTSTKFYRWLVQEGFPEGFQTLCVPCNNSKHEGKRCRLEHS
jgi:5-methylcytosine-specific restriction endonuclease McrA